MSTLDERTYTRSEMASYVASRPYDERLQAIWEYLGKVEQAALLGLQVIKNLPEEVPLTDDPAFGELYGCWYDSDLMALAALDERQ